MLTRADRKSEAFREGERLAVAISEEFEELLDILEAEGDAEAFINSRRLAEQDYLPRERLPEADEEEISRYYVLRTPEEQARLPANDEDPYPDNAREVREDSDDGPP